MRTFQRTAFVTLIAGLGLLGCGGGSDKPASTGGSGGDGTGGNGTGGTAGDGTGATAGTAGAGGGATACDLSGTGKSHQAIPAETGNMTLTADTVWDLSGTVYVGDGETLTVEPCTRIEGAKAPLGVLIVERGGKIMANGTASAPIAFTSAAAPGERFAGDWGGIILLGRAPNFQGDQVNIEGTAADPRHQHGGTSAADSSGSMTYVGILFAGYELVTGSEINGLTMGSVGTGTTIENIFVGQAADDCFEWFGGTVNGSYLICQNSDDDTFDTDYGYTGTLENLFARHTMAPTEGSNGLEMGYDNAVAITPTFNTDVTYRNATSCGFGSDIPTADGYGILSRAYVTGTVDEYVATGFDYGYNVDKPPVDPTVVMSNTVFYGMFANTTDPNAQIANPGDNDANDGAFNELTAFNAGTNNSATALGFSVADCNGAGGPAANVKSSARGAFKTSATWLDWVPADWWAEN